MSAPLPSDSQRLAEQLDEVARREAWLRVKVAHDFMTLETQVKAFRKKVDELNHELGERNAYVHKLHSDLEARDTRIHELHMEREARARDEQAWYAECAAYAELLRVAEDERDALRAEVKRLKSKNSWGPWR